MESLKNTFRINFIPRFFRWKAQAIHHLHNSLSLSISLTLSLSLSPFLSFSHPITHLLKCARNALYIVPTPTLTSLFNPYAIHFSLSLSIPQIYLQSWPNKALFLSKPHTVSLSPPYPKPSSGSHSQTSLCLSHTCICLSLSLLKVCSYPSCFRPHPLNGLLRPFNVSLFYVRLGTLHNGMGERVTR